MILPWLCPAVDVPADATVFRDTDAGLADTFDALRDEALLWWDDTCVWTVAALSETVTESTCVTDAGAAIRYTTMDDAWSEDFAYFSGDGWALEVEPPAGGASWTALSLGYSFSEGSSGSESWGGTVHDASWTGSLLDLPDDGWFTVAAGTGSRAVSTPSCAWRWDYDDAIGGETVEVGGHRVRVTSYAMDCGGGYPTKASVDGTLYGSVDLATWELDEVDRDGWSTAAGDCDDDAPAINPCATEVALDGIDQDCDGIDLADGDGDGYDAASAGGGDCDDTSPLAHPGARDAGGDGVDRDCDGADDVDADADGYTADGDDRAADCDDTDADTYPGQYETAYDGIDQNCDGVDLTDNDGDGYDGAEVGGDDCDDGTGRVNPAEVEIACNGVDEDCDGSDDCASPEPDPEDGEEGEERSGCRGGGAALLLGLFARRRRPLA